MDVTIKNVPVEAIASVKQMAMVAIERHLRKNLTLSELEIQNFENSVNSIYTTNDLPKKYKEKK